MQHGIWRTGLLAVLAALLTTGKAWVDDDNKGDGGVRKELAKLHRDVDNVREAVKELIRRHGVTEATPASEVSPLHLRIQALERDVQELRALVAERKRSESVLEVEGIAVEPSSLRTTVTVPATRVPHYYYVYPSCGCGYYYPTAWYYSYPAYYYPSWSWWYGW
jgi:hypothetical protein